MKPNANLHNPAPEYIRGLVERSKLSQRECARRLGISERMMRYYIAEASADHRPAPYLVQFGLEQLAGPTD